MLEDQIFVAEDVSRWPSLGVKLPDGLANAIEIFESLRWVEVGRPVGFDLAGVTADNAEDKILEFANKLALSEPLPRTNGAVSRSLLETAKTRALQAATTGVLHQAAGAVPSVIAQLTPAFDQHAAAYVEAVGQLPDELTAETLVSAGPDALHAYAAAQTESAHLRRVSAWVGETGSLPGGARKAEPVIRILRPANAWELAKLDEAHQLNASRELAAIGPVFFTAAKMGIEFGINTLRSCARIRESMVLRPAARV
jgi:hypothetical protein